MTPMERLRRRVVELELEIAKMQEQIAMLLDRKGSS